MKGELKPIRSKADYRNTRAEIERLWGQKAERRQATGSIFWRH
jgi:hypothetical protein